MVRSAIPATVCGTTTGISSTLSTKPFAKKSLRARIYAAGIPSTRDIKVATSPAYMDSDMDFITDFSQAALISAGRSVTTCLITMLASVTTTNNSSTNARKRNKSISGSGTFLLVSMRLVCFFLNIRWCYQILTVLNLTRPGKFNPHSPGRVVCL